MKEDSRLAWGVSLLVLGLLFLLKKIGVFPVTAEEIIFDIRNIPLALGLIFLFTHHNKSIGIVLISVAVLFYLKDLMILTQRLSDLIWPVLLIGAGVIIIFSNKTKPRKIDRSETPDKTTTPAKTEELSE